MTASPPPSSSSKKRPQNPTSLQSNNNSIPTTSTTTSYNNNNNNNKKKSLTLASILASDAKYERSLFRREEAPASSISSGNSIPTPTPQQLKNELIEEGGGYDDAIERGNDVSLASRENEYQARWRRRLEAMGGMEALLQQEAKSRSFITNNNNKQQLPTSSSLPPDSSSLQHQKYMEQLEMQQKQKEIEGLKRKIQRMEERQSVKERATKRRKLLDDRQEQQQQQQQQMHHAHWQAAHPHEVPPLQTHHIKSEYREHHNRNHHPMPPYPHPSAYPSAAAAPYHHMPPYPPHPYGPRGYPMPPPSHHVKQEQPPSPSQQDTTTLTDFVDYGLSGLLYKNQQDIKILKWKPDERVRNPPLPPGRWRLYKLENGVASAKPLLLSKSYILFGSDKDTADVHMSSLLLDDQHAVICFRQVSRRTGGASSKGGSGPAPAAVKPYIIDLESQHGTTLNGKSIASARYYELRHGDRLQFGPSMTGARGNTAMYSVVDTERAKKSV